MILLPIPEHYYDTKHVNVFTCFIFFMLRYTNNTNTRAIEFNPKQNVYNAITVTHDYISHTIYTNKLVDILFYIKHTIIYTHTQQYHYLIRLPGNTLSPKQLIQPTTHSPVHNKYTVYCTPLPIHTDDKAFYPRFIMFIFIHIRTHKE